MNGSFATIGHSNRPLDEVVAMLREAQVELLLDVRAFPRSRSNPAFNIETLPADLGRFQIAYRHCRALGGRRLRDVSVDEELNAGWRVRSFHNFADYALGDEFGAAFDELVRLGAEHPVAIMCSEAVWWRCHRRIIADYLLLDGFPVCHLMAPGRVEEAVPTSFARRIAGRKTIYPSPT
jgi:uncharacterized protein (DUF488 family)